MSSIVSRLWSKPSFFSYQQNHNHAQTVESKPQIHRIKPKHPNKRKKEEGKGQRLVTRRHFLKSFCLRLPEREEGWGLDLSLRVMGSPWAERFISASFWRRCFCTTLNFAMAKPLPLLSYRTLEGTRRRKALVVPSLVFPIVGGIFGMHTLFYSDTIGDTNRSSHLPSNT